MSGGMFPHTECVESEGGGEGEWNPLLCFLCHQTYREPCLLACYHSFCAPCLKGRSLEGKLSCPICGFVSQTPALQCQRYLFTGRSQTSETVTPSRLQTLCSASLWSLPVTSIPLVPTATGMRRRRCSSVTPVVSKLRLLRKRLADRNRPEKRKY